MASARAKELREAAKDMGRKKLPPAAAKQTLEEQKRAANTKVSADWGGVGGQDGSHVREACQARPAGLGGSSAGAVLNWAQKDTDRPAVLGGIHREQIAGPVVGHVGKTTANPNTHSRALPDMYFGHAGSAVRQPEDPVSRHKPDLTLRSPSPASAWATSRPRPSTPSPSVA